MDSGVAGRSIVAMPVGSGRGQNERGVVGGGEGGKAAVGGLRHEVSLSVPVAARLLGAGQGGRGVGRNLMRSAHGVVAGGGGIGEGGMNGGGGGEECE